MRVLVTGATGYIGGRLVPRLLERGHEVRVLVRDPRRIDGRAWAGRVEVTTGDAREADCWPAALDGVDAAYYLIHSMSGSEDFEAADRRAAEAFGGAAREAGLAHAIYLGGLQPPATCSAHLQSRAEVGSILARAVPTTELRAGPIIGSGSASFEMVRYLTERLPVMIAPKWILNDVQPIAVRDMLDYLIRALDRGPLGVVDVGADRLSFRSMMRVYAEVRGYRRVILPVPVLAPGLAARWVGAVTPIPNRLAVPLVKGILRPVLADTTKAEREFPDVRPMPYRDAVRRALRRTLGGEVETRWSGALGGGDAMTHDTVDREGVIREVRTLLTRAPRERVFRSFASLGGERGWLFWDWAWRLRGLLDALVGGPGLRRGRRHPVELLPGEALDFWRVEHVERPKEVRLRAEMKVPGHARLQWEAHEEQGGTRLVMTALFVPRGVTGLAYWYALLPVHRYMFTGLIRAVARSAERDEVPGGREAASVEQLDRQPLAEQPAGRDP